MAVRIQPHIQFRIPITAWAVIALAFGIFVGTLIILGSIYS
jgi:hypothetical protein